MIQKFVIGDRVKIVRSPITGRTGVIIDNINLVSMYQVVMDNGEKIYLNWWQLEPIDVPASTTQRLARAIVYGYNCNKDDLKDLL